MMKAGDAIPARKQDTDVLVIGAGLIGAVIAAQLASRGMKVAVVDALPVASGATRCALSLATPDVSPANMAATTRGVDMLMNLALCCNVVPRPASVLHVSGHPDRVNALRALAGAAGPGAPQMHWETDAASVPQGFDGALRVHNSILVDAVTLTVKLLQQPNIIVRPHLEIQSLEGGSGGVVALASDYTLSAGAVVLAANVYAGFLSPYLADAAHVARGAVWRSRLISKPIASLATTVLVDNAQLVATQTPDQRLYVAAWHWDGRARGDPAEAVRAYLNLHLPEMLNETEAWCSTATTATPDGVPLIGALSTGDTAGRVFYALGPGAYSMAWAPIIAEQVADLVSRT